MSNEAHENGFKAARKWILMGDAEEMPNESHIRNYVEGAIKAYLDASGLVLVPREPSADMMADGMEVYCRKDDAEEDVWNVYHEMIAAAPDPFRVK